MDTKKWKVKKRNGKLLDFDIEKVKNAITKAVRSIGIENVKLAETISELVKNEVVEIMNGNGNEISVEKIQDIIEKKLIDSGYRDIAKAYINYRDERARIRDEKSRISEDVKKMFYNSSKYFKNQLGEFVYYRTYSRWVSEKGRRETWIETVDRYVEFMKENMKSKLTSEEYKEVRNAILNQDIVPSMRLLQFSGEAARRSNICSFNCTYLSIKKLEDFRDAIYILMHGCGVGFSVESTFVEQLPQIKKQRKADKEKYVIEDSREGWANALYFGLINWYSGNDVEFDYSLIRPAGAKLKTFGGRACLTGDTIVYKDRKKSKGYNEMKIGELYNMKISGKRRFCEDAEQDGSSHVDMIKIRSLDESSGEFFRNKLLDIVYNGKAPVYEILTENGYRIKATDNHRFMNSAGEYQYLANFNIGDVIAVNGSAEIKTGICIDCQSSISRRSMRCVPCNNKAQQKTDALFTTARQRKECRDALGNECETCGVSNTRLIVHHEDENPLNNERNNLTTLCEECHRKHHFKKWTFGDAYSHKYISYDAIISIEYIGVEDVYDLVMEGPNNNFVANGFVSHNSGPMPLKSLLDFTRGKILDKQARRLKPIDVHDIMCKIGEIVVAGGVRRSAEISLSDLDDQDLRRAKFGAFYTTNPQRSMSNNSAVYNNKPTITQFLDEWTDLIKSGAGERGIFNRGGLEKQLPKRRLDKNKEYIDAMGTNPCGEIYLRDHEMCNLSEVVARPEDTKETLKNKIKLATILGTYQATLTDFKFISDEWQKNCNEERLLGVSITGQMDCPILNDSELLRELKEYSMEINKEYSIRFDIPESMAITCVKPSGNTSQTVDCASGLHPRYAPYYLRRIRINSTDPLFKMMKNQKVPYYPEVGQTMESASTFVFEFPIKSPEGAVCRNDVSSLDQLEYWKKIKKNYTEHNPSITVYVGDEEWLEVGNWVYKNWDIVGGLSFLPRYNHVYQLAPYEEITKEEYEKRIETFPDLDFSDLVLYEFEDETERKQELACSGGACLLE